MQTDRDFDIAVTFAGEDRAFVEEVVELVKSDGFSVFYDEDAKEQLWGEDLTEFFADVYERRARFAVMFISASYVAKAWTRLERRSVLTRAMQSASTYLLPVRFDSTQLPGVRSTIGYLEAHIEGPSGVAKAIKSKLQHPVSSGDRNFNGRVPRTAAEAGILLGERPPAWEYLYLCYLLSVGIRDNQTKYADHQLSFALADEFVRDEDALDRCSVELARLSSTTEMFDRLVNSPSLDRAVGAPGEEGDPDAIEHLANRLITVYANMLDWSYRVRALSTSAAEGRAMFLALSQYVNQPIEAIRGFVNAFRREADEITATLKRGDTPQVSFQIKFEIPPDVMDKYDKALTVFAGSRR